MPATYLAPGVYIEEVPSGVRAIAGVSTADTAFVDFFARGPANRPVRCASWGDFERAFGGLDRRSEASYAIRQFFLNGGSVAWVVRVTAPNAEAAEWSSDEMAGASGASGASGAGGEPILVAAASRGDWGNSLWVGVEAHGNRFDVVVAEKLRVRNRDEMRVLEVFRNLSSAPADPRYAQSVVAASSGLIRVDCDDLGGVVASTGAEIIAFPTPDKFRQLRGGLDGTGPGMPDWINGDGAEAVIGSEGGKTGLFALERIAPAVFNILCIPMVAYVSEGSRLSIIQQGLRYCETKRAFFIVDVPAAIDDASPDQQVTQMQAYLTALEGAGHRHPNGAVYFPRLQVPDPVNENRPRVVASSGTLAGIYARTDATRGVWKAPAGTEAELRGASPAYKMSDGENEQLNPVAVNALRSFPVYGSVTWGARTLEGAMANPTDWTYIPVRRTALYIEESLRQGLQWVVFEPNDEPLWAQIRLNVGSFMHGLFRQGAFQGKSPREAYLVKCDSETTTQADIDLGRVNILVGFAPLKPAEFVIVRIQQLTQAREP